ncbi:MAG: molybdenum cofactor biosynthesis protein B [Deinococcales bacterium]
MSSEQHRQTAQKQIRAAVLTISDSRTLETDSSGAFLAQALLEQEHLVLARAIVKDDPEAILAQLEQWLSTDVQVIFSTGGTGITKRDNTIPVIESLLEKPMPGFGELFRMLSYQEVGAAAMLSRATGGLAKGGKCLIFAMPGSLNAVKTAWKGIFAKELPHLVHEVVR